MSDLNINEDAQSGGECSGSQQSNANPPSQPEESAFPDEDEETITMLDVIEQENKLEEEASAVLGNSDEKNCTYPKGYIARQALYSCATCSEDPENMAAICLACSLECHDNHEVIELYTKRGYRCDCGNSKFKPDFECKFITDKQARKAPINEQNKYNHNFSGRYCSCDKRYPPDENDNSAEAHDEMWQCIVCEDWYHTKHLGVTTLPTKFDELICGPCVDKLDFVHHYRDHIDNSSASGECLLEKYKKLNELKRAREEGLTTGADQSKSLDKSDPIFWPDCSWRTRLCRCVGCTQMYKDKECEYLLDEKDTVQYYEAQGRAIVRETPFERGMSALNQMSRTAVVEALHGYDELKADLSTYLKKFAENKKVVREEDIHDFFNQLRSKKRPRLEYE